MKNWNEIGQMLVSGALGDTKKMRKEQQRMVRQKIVTKYGGEPFVLLFETITFGSPTGGKEIVVVVKN